MDTVHNKTQVVIIGGGITGLSLAAQLARSDIDFVVLEKADRLGGQIRTLSEKGFTFEVGPNTGTVSNPQVTELFEFAETAELEVAQGSAKSRWIWKGGSFYALPSGLLSAIATPLFRFRDKIRILGEPFRHRGTNPDETVGALARRRLGNSFVDYAVDPFISGIYAGDPNTLVTRFALPKLYRLEYEYGSFIKGSIAKARQPKSERDRKATKEVFSARGGLENLIKALATKLANFGTLVTNASDTKVIKGDDTCWQVSWLDGDGNRCVVETNNVVTTVRADQLPELLPSEISSELDPITSLKYAPVVEVCVGFDHLPNVRRDAFGGLVPSLEHRSILGILFPSSCFTERTAYPDGALFTIFMGGIRDQSNIIEQTDEQIEASALAELKEMMGIDPELVPDLVHIARYPKAIPQYLSDSAARIDRIAAIEANNPGLILAGGIRDGIGLANRIEQGEQIGLQLANKA